MSFPWIHESEMQAARAEAALEAAGVFCRSPQEREYDRRSKERLEADPNYRRWHARREARLRAQAGQREPEAE